MLVRETLSTRCLCLTKIKQERILMRQPDAAGTQVWWRMYTYLGYDGFVYLPIAMGINQLPTKN